MNENDTEGSMFHLKELRSSNGETKRIQFQLLSLFLIMIFFTSKLWQIFSIIQIHNQIRLSIRKNNYKVE